MPWFSSYYDVGRHVDSRLTPTFLHNTVDNPMQPHSGLRVTGSVQMASRRLGGSYDYVKPEGEAIYYWPLTRRTGFGFRAQGGWLRPYGATRQLPYYLRYFLGGEYQIRGVDIRSVGPIDANDRALGGNKFVLFNAEYWVDVAGPVRAAIFHDAGQAFSEKQRIDLRQLRTSSGVEVRVIMPMLNVPFRLIWARNLYRDAFQPASAFKFAVGTTF
jgi:outer membrane protein insertion porin family